MSGLHCPRADYGVSWKGLHPALTCLTKMCCRSGCPSSSRASATSALSADAMYSLMIPMAVALYA